MEQYENYKDSGIEYIGKIPEHWEVKKLKFCFKFATGFTPSTGNSEYYIDGDNIWITIADMQDKIIKDSNQKITDFAIEQNKAQIIPKGALLYSFKLSVGKVAFTGIDCYTNEAIFSVLPSNDVNLGFYYYSLPEQVIKNANENIYGAKLLNQDLIKNAIIVVPKAYEQVAIADFLDRKTAEIDKIIANKQKLIALYEEEKQAIINQAVTKGLDPNVKMKDSGVEWLGEIPEHWEVKKLKYITEMKSGEGITSEQIKENGEYPVFGGNGKRGYYDKYTHKGDYVLIGRQGALCGNINYASNRFWASEHAIVCTIKNDNNTKWLGILLNIMNLNQYSVSAAQPGLSIDNLKTLKIPTPKILEQQKIASQIEIKCRHLDSIISKYNKQIELFQEYRTTLISEVVTGKVKAN